LGSIAIRGIVYDQAFFIAKLANIYADSCKDFGKDLSKVIDINRIVSSLDDDFLRNDGLFDYLSKFLLELFSLLLRKVHSGGMKL